MDDTSIKKNIAASREKAGLSQAEMALRLGISRPAYRNIEKGDTVLLKEVLVRIAGELNVSVEYLLLGYDPEPCPESFLRERDGLNQRIASLTEDYEERLARLRDDNALLRRLVDSHEETIRALKQINSRLEKETR